MFYFLVNPHRVDCKTKRKKVSVIKRLANEAESANIVVTNLKTGLKQQEVESLRTQYGANEFTKPKTAPVFSPREFIRGFLIKAK